MSFINQPSRVIYIAEAGQTEFDFGFKWFEETDINVYLTPAGQVPNDETDKLDPLQYSITPVGANIGGKITLNTGATLDDTIVIDREIPVDRLIEYVTNGDFLATVVNEDQDYQSYILQDFFSLSKQFIKLPTAGIEHDIKLFPPFPEAYLRWNEAGDGVIPDTEPSSWRTETEELRNETEAFRNETETFRNEAESAKNEATNQANRAESEADRAQGISDAIVPVGDAQVARVIAEGDTQEARVTSEGDTQVARVTAEGDTQVARVISEGDAKIHDAQLEAWNAEAEAMTADSYANQPEDVLVDEYTSNGDGTFTATPIPNTYSSLHWSLKSGQSASGLNFQGAWDASSGSYPTTKPPEGTGSPLEPGDLFVVEVAGNIEGTDWFIRDWMVRNVTNDGWYRVPQTVDWGAIINIPDNVNFALDSRGGSMTGALSMRTPQGALATINFNDDGVVLWRLIKGTNGNFVLRNESNDNVFTVDKDTTILNFTTPPTAPTPTQANHLTRKDYVDTGLAGKVGSSDSGNENKISRMVSMTQADYDAITPVADTLYVIVG